VAVMMTGRKGMFLLGQLALRVLEPQWDRLHPLMLDLVLTLLLLV
jgi:hypothetical protein